MIVFQPFTGPAATTGPAGTFKLGAGPGSRLIAVCVVAYDGTWKTHTCSIALHCQQTDTFYAHDFLTLYKQKPALIDMTALKLGKSMYDQHSDILLRQVEQFACCSLNDGSSGDYGHLTW